MVLQCPFGDDIDEERRHADAEGGPVNSIDLLRDLHRLGRDAFRSEGEPEQPAELANEDVEGNAVQEADQDGFGKEVGDRAEPQETRGDAEEPRDRGHGDRHGQVQFGVAARERRDGGGDQCARRRVGTDDQRREVPNSA